MPASTEYPNPPWFDLMIKVFMCLGVAFIIYNLYAFYRLMTEPIRFTERFSYLKELNLYQSLDVKKRQQYLNMSRDEKIAQYKRQLTQ